VENEIRWTEEALHHYLLVQDYLHQRFGSRVCEDFEQRIKDFTRRVQLHPYHAPEVLGKPGLYRAIIHPQLVLHYKPMKGCIWIVSLHTTRAKQ
jgi:plasmid stabilization system protein ParE